MQLCQQHIPQKVMNIANFGHEWLRKSHEFSQSKYFGNPATDVDYRDVFCLFL